MRTALSVPTSTSATYHECWYPVAQSSDVDGDAVLGLSVLGGRIIVYRTSDGLAHAMSASCRHLGADLALGDRIGDDVRCAFHHWQYGADGSCTAIPTGDRIPSRARLTVFPTEEAWGLIWIFFGVEPRYPVPTFPSWDERMVTYSTFEVAFEGKLDCDPWVFASNAFDFQHLDSVHGLKLVETADTSVSETSMAMQCAGDNQAGNAGEVQMNLILWGTNCVVTDNRVQNQRARHIAAGTPFNELGTRFFFVVATEADSDDPAAVERASAVLDHMRERHTRIVNEDLPILNSLDLDEHLLVGADRALARYWRYADAYPKTSFRELAGRSTRTADAS